MFDAIKTWSEQLAEYGAANGYDETAVNPLVASRVYPFLTEREALDLAASWLKIARSIQQGYENGDLPSRVGEAQDRMYREIARYGDWVNTFAPLNIDPGGSELISPLDSVNLWDHTQDVAIALASLDLTPTVSDAVTDAIIHPWSGSGWSLGDAYSDLGAKFPAPFGDWGTTMAVFAVVGLFLLARGRE